MRKPVKKLRTVCLMLLWVSGSARSQPTLDELQSVEPDSAQPDDIAEDKPRIALPEYHFAGRAVNYNGGNTESKRFREILLENFFLKNLRIEFQKSQILHKFAPDELPRHLKNIRDGVSGEDYMNEMKDESTENIDNYPNDQEMIEFFQNGHSLEDNDFDIDLIPHADDHNSPLPADDPADKWTDTDEDVAGITDSWLNYFRPIFRFYKDNYRTLMHEFEEQKKRLQQRWQYLQDSSAQAIVDADLSLQDDDKYSYNEDAFEAVDVQRELIFLDEGRGRDLCDFGTRWVYMMVSPQT